MGGVLTNTNRKESFNVKGIKYPSSPKPHHRKGHKAKNKTTKKAAFKRNHDSVTSILEGNGSWKEFKKYPFQNLVLSGGGSKGYAFVGALKVSFRFLVYLSNTSQIYNKIKISYCAVACIQSHIILSFVKLHNLLLAYKLINSFDFTLF